jgi:hypothetical protein
MHPVDIYALVDAALPQQWMGFAVLGAATVLTVVSIALVVYAGNQR